MPGIRVYGNHLAAIETLAYVRANKDSLVKRTGLLGSFEGFVLADVSSSWIPTGQPDDIRYMMKQTFHDRLFDDAVNWDLIDIEFMRQQKQLVGTPFQGRGHLFFKTP